MDDEKRRPGLTEGEEAGFSPIFFETRGVMGKIEKGIHWVASSVMILICIVILGGILLSFLRIPSYFEDLIHGQPGSLIALLEYAAEIIIAVELIYVIVAQNLESVIEILMIAFTRELVIGRWQMWEILLGVAVIGGLFAVRKFLMHNKK